MLKCQNWVVTFKLGQGQNKCQLRLPFIHIIDANFHFESPSQFRDTDQTLAEKKKEGKKTLNGDLALIRVKYTLGYH